MIDKNLVVVQRLPIFPLVITFVFYIITHILIGMWVKKVENKENKTEEELNTLKFANILFKWYPAVFVVVCIFILLQ